jgi:hypothetical protein
VLVEGQTEETFLPTAFERKFGVSLNSKLTNIVNVKGVTNIAGFATAMTKVLEAENIYILMDNDGSENLDEIIARLDIPDEQICRTGDKEFEDAFTDSQLCSSWEEHVSGNTGVNWTEEDIADCRAECSECGAKFSKQIKSLNAGGSKMTKPEFGQSLATFVDTDNFPDEINNFLETIYES